MSLLTLTSFSHRRGPLVPAPTSGLAFDVRTLPNPPKHIRDKYFGIHKPLRVALMADPTCRQRISDMQNAIDDVLRRYEQVEEPVHIRVGVCCEMGRHRSVACVEELARVPWPSGWTIEVVHRDLTRRRSERDKEKRPRKVQRDESD